MSTTQRPRSASLQKALKGIERDPRHHIAGALNPATPLSSTPGSPARSRSPDSKSRGVWYDILTMKWMVDPSLSLKILGLPILLYINWAVVAPHYDNPFRKFLWVTNRLPDSPEGFPMYAKSYWDLAFVAYYIVVFSFIRQSSFFYVFKPIARHYGIHREAKLDRFAEQAYAAVYFACAGLLGLWTMYTYLPTWYFRTEYFWLNYPHWQMPGTIKPYYLLQGANWCHQFLLLVLKMEKPRSDWAELVAHHIVTLHLIGWSYLTSMTPMGNAVFLTMDWSDVFFSVAKLFNYLDMTKTKTIAFAWFVCVWTYTRHYLNLIMLWSIWYEYDLIEEWARVWAPSKGVWMAKWIQYQMFLPLAILQLINVFWYFLIWRILLRAIFSSNLDDSRSDDEDEAAEPANKKKKSD